MNVSVIVSEPSWLYSKVPLDFRLKAPPKWLNGPDPGTKVAVKTSLSVSVSLANTVLEIVVELAVPPSSTVMVSGFPTGVSFWGTTVITKVLLTSVEQLATPSVAYKMIVLLPVILSTKSKVRVVVFKVADSKAKFVLLTVSVIVFNSSSVNTGLKSISKSAASSITVWVVIALATIGQSFVCVICIVTVVVFPRTPLPS